MTEDSNGTTIDREDRRFSLGLCEDLRLVAFFAYANELTSLVGHVTSSLPLLYRSYLLLTVNSSQVELSKFLFSKFT